MRWQCVAFSVICLVLIGGCSKREEAPTADPPPAQSGAVAKATASAAASASAAAEVQVAPTMGGSLVAVGDHHVELKLYKRGEVEAWVLDARGKLVAKPQDYKLTVKQKGEAAQKIDMQWSKPQARFVGEADAELTPGKYVVELDANGKVATGALARAVLLVGPSFGGTMMVAGRHGVEVAADASGSVNALVRTSAGATVKGGIDVAADVQADAGKKLRIDLGYDAKLARFHGEAKAGVKLAPGPIALFIDGKLAARLPTLALRAEASHEGRVLLVGDYSVELVGEGAMVSAFVADATAAAHAKGDLDVQLQLAGGKLLTLAWHAPSASYRAKLAADFDFDAQPIRLVIQAGGKVHVGGYASAKAVANAKLKAPSADVKATGKAGAKAKAGAKGGIKIPGVNVKTHSGKKGKTGVKAGFSIGTK